MKNLKAKLMSILILGSIMTPIASVNAANLGSGLAKEQQKLLNQQTRQQIQQIKQTIKSNDATNIGLKNQNMELRKNIKTIIQQIKQSKNVLPTADLTNIENQAATVKQDVATLQATQANMQADRSAVKSDEHSKNYQDLITQLNNIISVQGTRTVDLQKTNQDLNTLLNLVKTAQADSEAGHTTT